MELILIIATLLGGISAIWFFFDKLNLVMNSTFLRSKKVIPESVFDISDAEFSFIDKNIETLCGNGHRPVNSMETERCLSLENIGILTQCKSGAYIIRKEAKSLLFKDKA